MMEYCVRTARAAGVFKEFHVLCDRPLEGCECYDAYELEKTHGLFKLHYLKVGMSRLSFDFFVWLDADTMFARNPVDLLGPMGKSPMHVPLEASVWALGENCPSRGTAGGDARGPDAKVSGLEEDCLWKGTPLGRLRELWRQEGVANQMYVSQSAFWIIHHDAIETAYELAMGFWHKADHAGLEVEVSAALGYAMQMLCADPEAHLLVNHADLWASDDESHFRDSLPDGTAWSWRHRQWTDAVEIQPSIIHLPKSKELLAAPRMPSAGSVY